LSFSVNSNQRKYFVEIDLKSDYLSASMKIIKPKRLKRGDVIGICAPASPPASAEKLNDGIKYIERCGFRIEVGKHLNRRHGYLAGTDKERAEDLNNLFANKNVKAIFAARGGYGTQRILPLLNYRMIKNNPKIVVGYSDITALHLALFEKVGLLSFSGPMAAVEMSEGLKGEIEERFWDGLMTAKPPKPIIAKNISSTFNRSGKAEGRLLAGNLSLVAAMCGTKYFPRLKNYILLIEEIDEKPYRVDRMLEQLKLAGLFNSCAGVALGKFISCVPDKGKPSLTLQQVFKDQFGKNKFPVVSEIPYGHFKASLPFPVGVKVKLNGDKNILEFLESGVC
jgi:muramoyltetrapeptide carboxypeptidase